MTTCVDNVAGRARSRTTSLSPPPGRSLPRSRRTTQSMTPALQFVEAPGPNHGRRIRVLTAVDHRHRRATVRRPVVVPRLTALSGRQPTGGRRVAAAAKSARPPSPAGPAPSAPPQFGGPATHQWQGGQNWPEARPAPPAPSADWSYTDRINYTELVPQRRTLPGRGWRKALYQATFGLINLGPSPDERRQAELEAKIRSLLRGHYKIGVLGKGGVGKTTVAAAVGSVFAELRRKTGSSRSTRTPRSASWVVASTRRRPGRIGSWRPTSTWTRSRHS